MSNFFLFFFLKFHSDILKFFRMNSIRFETKLKFHYSHYLHQSKVFCALSVLGVRYYGIRRENRSFLYKTIGINHHPILFKYSFLQFASSDIPHVSPLRILCIRLLLLLLILGKLFLATIMIIVMTKFNFCVKHSESMRYPMNAREKDDYYYHYYHYLDCL